MTKLMSTIAALLFLASFAIPAQAKVQKQVTQFCGDRYCDSSLAVAREPSRYVSRTYNSSHSYDGHIVAHPSGCPLVRFCGCGVSVKVFGRPIRDLFLARNWFKFPHASPGPGMVAVRNGHVMYIIAYDGNGSATVYDPNSGGHKTRIHTRSLSGYRIVDPRSRIASR